MSTVSVRRLLIVGVLLVAAVGHWVYHYAPRLRAAAPADELAARLLHDPSYDLAVWVPYPHQTLPALERRSGVDAEALAAAAALLGVDLPLASLRGRGLPPAKELTVAASADGRRAAAAMRVYPLASVFARLAGHLADNPWLRGGEILRDGRRIVVRWHGTTWLAAMPDAPSLEPGTPSDEAPSLAIVRSARPLGAVPAGRFHLRTDGDALQMASEAAAPRPPVLLDARFDDASADRSGDRPVLVAWAAAPRRALLLAPPRVEGAGELPRTASLVEPGGRRWRLPAEGLLAATGHEPVEASWAGWRAVASDADALAAAGRLMPRLDAEQAALAPLAFGLWLDLGPADTEVTRLARQAADSPLLAARERRRAAAVAVLLQALARRHERAVLAVGDARGVVLRLESPTAEDTN